MRPDKVQYLEGLRGIAAMQVVLLHFVSGFMPDTAQHAWPPLHVLYDGHTAVYVFFLISGTVLTPSLHGPAAWWPRWRGVWCVSASRWPRQPPSPRR